MKRFQIFCIGLMGLCALLNGISAAICFYKDWITMGIVYAGMTLMYIIAAIYSGLSKRL